MRIVLPTVSMSVEPAEEIVVADAERAGGVGEADDEVPAGSYLAVLNLGPEPAADDPRAIDDPHGVAVEDLDRDRRQLGLVDRRNPAAAAKSTDTMSLVPGTPVGFQAGLLPHRAELALFQCLSNARAPVGCLRRRLHATAAAVGAARQTGTMREMLIATGPPSPSGPLPGERPPRRARRDGR